MEKLVTTFRDEPVRAAASERMSASSHWCWEVTPAASAGPLTACERFLSATLIALMLAAGSAAQAPPTAQVPAGQSLASDGPSRESNEESVNSLVARGLFDEAETLAAERMNAVALSTEDAARWAVTLSAVRLQKLLRAPMGDQAAHLDAATGPLDQVINAYPDHRRAAWLRFQRAIVDFAVARRQGLSVLATPDDLTARLAALVPLLETTRVLQELEQELVAEIAAAFGRRDRSSWIDELMALRNSVAVQRVEVLLSRGDLFPTGSDDYLAAAGQADMAATEALALVRQDPPRRAALIRMRCESLLRMGQGKQAAELLAPLLAAENQQADDAMQALAVRIAIESGQMAQAEQLLTAHYGDRPAEAPASTDLDLARLRYLIARQSGGDADDNQMRAIGDWLETIGLRGGDFARRRAEALVMESLGGLRSDVLDPRIALAQAAAMLRRGESLAAAELLDASARQSSDGAAAHALAVSGAAAYVKAQQVAHAAGLLRDIATAHGQLPQASDLHLQAAILLDGAARELSLARSNSSTSGEGDAVRAESVDELLRQTIARWPAEPSGIKARRWLVARLLGAGRVAEAAIAASPIENPKATEQEWEEASWRWSDALIRVPLLRNDFSIHSDHEQLLKRALEFLPTEPAAAQRCRNRLIVLFAAPEYLAKVHADADDELWVEWLSQIRHRNSGEPLRAGELPEHLRPAAVQRLVADALGDTARRASLASVILPLTENEISTERAHALLWSGDWQAADRLLDQWIASHNGGDAHTAAVTAARLLATSPQDEAKQKALQRYVAAGAELAQDSPQWHAVKLATIELLRELGQDDEAVRLARYIMLTRPPQDAAVKAAYRRLTNP